MGKLSVALSLAVGLALGTVFLSALVPVPVQAQVLPGARQFVSLAAGEEAVLYGITFRAEENASAIVLVSSELVTAAVIEGTLLQGLVAARAGEALVTPIDGSRPRRYGYDARRLISSLPPQWVSQAQAPLEQLSDRQARRAFWGLIEPVGTNAAAPVTPQAEAFRQAYLGNETVLGLRRAAAGDRQELAALTLQRFVEAVTAGDREVIAHLIDPLPFTNASSDPAIWLPARQLVADRLLADGALAGSFDQGAITAVDENGTVVVGGFRIGLVMRDRAMFIAAVEPLS
jgi:hypothetical protein